MNTPEYLLSVVEEECNEIAQRATKAQRFGLAEIQPGQELTNKERLIQEFNDLLGTLELLFGRPFIHCVRPSMIEAKKAKVQKFMEYSRELGMLKD